MLIYILIVYMYRAHAVPTTPPLPPFYSPPGFGTSPSSSNSPLVTPFIHSLGQILPRAISASGRNTCSTGERGLYDIVSSCAVTLFACIYKALHPNVPSQELGWRGRLWIKTRLALYMLIAPELIVFWAAEQWIGARKIAKEINAIDKDIKWTAAHGHFVQILALGRKDDGKPLMWQWEDIYNPSQHNSRDETEKQGKRLALKSLFSEGFIELESLRSIKEEDIMDRSKGDFLSKLFAVLQASWFILGCIARHYKQLPLTELEVITLASAVINCILYILWWNKPQNVERRQYLTIRSEPGDKPEPAPDVQVLPLRMHISQWYHSFTKNPLQFSRQPLPIHNFYGDLSSGDGDTNAKATKERGFADFVTSLLGPFDRDVIRTVDDINLSRNAQFFAIEVTKEDLKFVYGLALAFTVAFGALHFIAWNFVFPSRTELALWRVSCLVLLVAPTVPMTLLLAYFMSEIEFVADAMTFASLLSIPSYIFARFCVLVLVFVALRDPDPQIFVDIPWTCYIPHL